MIRKKQSGVTAWIAAQGGRETARLTLTYLAQEVGKVTPQLLELLVDEYGDELPQYAVAREILEQER